MEISVIMHQRPPCDRDTSGPLDLTSAGLVARADNEEEEEGVWPALPGPPGPPPAGLERVVE